MVVFEDGLARKSEYRRFAIKGLDGTDDISAIHEVITRRFRRYLEEREQTGELDTLGDPAAGDPAAGDPGEGHDESQDQDLEQIAEQTGVKAPRSSRIRRTWWSSTAARARRTPRRVP